MKYNITWDVSISTPTTTTTTTTKATTTGKVKETEKPDGKTGKSTGEKDPTMIIIIESGKKERQSAAFHRSATVYLNRLKTKNA